MSRRLLTVGPALAVLLAVGNWAGRAAAKPPDLPLADKSELAPAGDTPSMEPLFIMRPSARRTMASCLIFGVHPLLTLTPTGDYVAFDDDDAPEVPTVFSAPAAAEAPHASITISVGVSSDAGLTGGIEITTTPMQTQKGVPNEGAESVCPWMRQHAVPPQDAPASDFDAAHDVLHNLEMLRQAQLLLDDARELGRAGRIADAFDCLDLVRTLCPGSRIDDAVQQTAAELFAPLFCGSPDGATGAEDAAVDCKAEKEREIERKLRQPVTLRFEETPLRQVIDDIGACEGINICVDKAALDEKEISLDYPVTINLEVVSLKTALKLMLEPAHLTYAVKNDVLQITTEPAGRRPGRITYEVGDTNVPVPDDAVPLTPCLPPVDVDTPAALDLLLNEGNYSLSPSHEIEKASYERVEDEPAADTSKGAAKPFRKADGLNDVGCGKDGGGAEDDMPDLPHGSFEFGFGLDGSVQMFTQLRRGGAVWHLYYGNSGLSVWASPVVGDASGDCHAPDSAVCK